MELLTLVSGAISSTCTACPWKAELTEARCQANYWGAALLEQTENRVFSMG